MKNLIKLLFVTTLISLLFIGYSYFKYNEIKEIRDNIESFYSKEFYNESIENSINSIIKNADLKKEHKVWIKDFIIKELPRNQFEISYSFLLKKLWNKNIKLTGEQQDIVSKEFLKIKMASEERNTNLLNSIKKYEKLTSNKYNAYLEKEFIGQKIDFYKVSN